MGLGLLIQVTNCVTFFIPVLDWPDAGQSGSRHDKNEIHYGRLRAEKNGWLAF
jgi:hypothetical protein